MDGADCFLFIVFALCDCESYSEAIPGWTALRGSIRGESEAFISACPYLTGLSSGRSSKRPFRCSSSFTVSNTAPAPTSPPRPLHFTVCCAMPHDTCLASLCRSNSANVRLAPSDVATVITHGGFLNCLATLSMMGPHHLCHSTCLLAPCTSHVEVIVLSFQRASVVEG